MKFLHTIAKILPRLETGSDQEKLLSLAAVDRILRANELDWHKVSEALRDFTTKVAGAEEEPPQVATTTRPGFRSTVRPAPPVRTPPVYTAPIRPQPAPRPQPTPTPPPRRNPAYPHANPAVDIRLYGTANDQYQVLTEVLNKGVCKTNVETAMVKQLQDICFTGLSLNVTQVTRLEPIVGRI